MGIAGLLSPLPCDKHRKVPGVFLRSEAALCVCFFHRDVKTAARAAVCALVSVAVGSLVVLAPPAPASTLEEKQH